MDNFGHGSVATIFAHSVYNIQRVPLRPAKNVNNWTFVVKELLRKKTSLQDSVLGVSMPVPHLGYIWIHFEANLGPAANKSLP